METNKIKLSLKGLDCPNCAAKIERKVNDLEEVKEASLNFAVQYIAIDIKDGFDSENVKTKVKEIVNSLEPDVVVSEYKNTKIKHANLKEGHAKINNLKEIEPRKIETPKEEKKENIFKENIPLFVGIAIYLLAVIFFQDKSYGVVLFLVSYALVGFEVILAALKNIFRGEIFDENFLMAVATIGAFSIKEYPEAVAVMIFYQIGEMFQDYAVNKSRKSISSLMDIKADYANILVNDKEKKVSPEDVDIDDIIVVRPGERVPLDGIIIEGESSLDTSALTGETVPRNAATNDEVLSGSINISGLLKIKVTKAYGESTVARILELVENAGSKKAKTEKFITKFAKVYTPTVVALAVLLAVIPTIFISGAEFSDWLYRALVFLVVSCPCALVISIPLGLFAGIGGASKKGVLIKGGNFVELLKDVDTVVFDKTGTLTKGTFNVVKVKAVNISEDELIRLAAMGESFSNHPIAKSIVQYYHKEIDKDIIKNYKEISGNGISVQIEDKNILLGNSKLMSSNNIKFESEETIGTIVYVAVNNEFKGYIIISDEIKETSKEAIKSLKQLGVKRTIMLTGDSKNVAEKVAKDIGIDSVYSELLPADKVEKVEKLLNEEEKNDKLVFVGDGINDAPVLARADIGVAMGGIGSDAAIEAADVVLMRDDPLALKDAIKIGRKTTGILWQNIVFALVVKVGVLILSTFGYANMWLGVFADVGVTLIAVLNSMRALRNN
ncbi:heavy metal translocating P-type ATPase [Clostridium sp. HCP1S3_B4]|uniref:heavy metal translocating P-type ATPase n=1 Tax=unclassified Clostridium TaxID=2614128 RepID=UPI003F89D229